ncbi:MAG: cytochrome c maturation protein CcmE [Alphaproteobacteria bacterium]|nr:cytochrome c maturation protein CcmE [Alphaproteobacteria bacterium]
MKKKQRLYFVIFVLAALGGALGLSLYALRDNISFFYSPREVAAMRAAGDMRIATGRSFRIGGLVEEGSVVKSSEEAKVSFSVTDGDERLMVHYAGILPDLFREGQGVVATGTLDTAGDFVAAELLAKHDENYMPPEVARALKQGHEEGKARLQQRATGGGFDDY